ncbi:MAG: VanZ family protein [Oscillospiraceae bacterium]|nr:VanZ family protein [Oscillospiraceae bacterium]
MQKLFNKKTAAFGFYAAAVILIAIYITADLLPNFLLSTAARLVLLCGGCLLLWAGGFLLAKSSGNNRPMKVNLWIFLVLYLALFLTLTLFDPMWGRNGGFGIVWTEELFDAYINNSLNLVPFRTIAAYLSSADFKTALINLGGNFVCLMPLGVLLPLISEKQNRAGVFLITCAAAVAAVELLQFATLAGSCDIDDLILNVGGAFAVFCIVKIKKVNEILRYIFLLEKGV